MFRLGLRNQRIRFDIQPLEHERQDRQAFPPAGGIEMPMASQFAFRRVSPPKLGHGERLEAVEVGILEELRGGAFPGSGRRYGLGRLAEDVAKVAGLPECIPHLEGMEEAHLQGDRAAVPFLL